jgi:hypothetical protein
MAIKSTMEHQGRFKMRNIIALSSLMALGLSGCMGGTTTAPTIDMTAVTGDGSAGAPYLLPSFIPTDTNGTPDDYMAQGGQWKHNIFNMLTTHSTANMEWLTEIVYDTANDTWYATYEDTTNPTVYPTLTYNSAKQRYTWASGSESAELYFSSTSQYGAFGYARSYSAPTSADVDNHAYFLTGLITNATDMPTSGSATYTGNFEVTWNDTTSSSYWQTTGGEFEARATFLSGTGSLDITTTQAATFNGTSNTYAISGSAIIDMHSFYTPLGGLTGTYVNTVTGTTTFDAGPGLDGFFFGPSADEIAGTFVQTSSALPDVQVVGGLWAAQ